MLGASWLVERTQPARTIQTDPRKTFIELPQFDQEGPIQDRSQSLPYLAWEAADPSGRVPVILIHGSPGDANNFAPGPGFGTQSPGLGPTIAATRDAYAIDMPGMGDHHEPVPTRASKAHARAVLAFMDAKGLDRAHLVGWSQGGAVVLHAADLQPDRVASITLLAAVGAQETEGSGGYFFEHAKYALGIAAVHTASWLLPDFGVLNSIALRPLKNSMHNFWDSDQRPLRGIMESTTTPALILHGRGDFLVAAWAAERHHQIMPTSSMVMTGSDHFMPFTEPEETAGHLEPFFVRHDQPGIAPLRTQTDLAPVGPHPLGLIGSQAQRFFHSAPWPIVVLLIACGAFFHPTLAAATAGLLVATLNEDLGVVFVGLIAGHTFRQSRRRGNLGPALLVPVLALGLAPLASSLAAQTPEIIRGLGWVTITIGLAMLLWVLPNLVRTRGRRNLRCTLRRAMRLEFWPPVLFYLPLIPYLVWTSLRRGGPRTFTCCNPGISALGGVGGGIVGESKARIQNALGDHPSILRTTLIRSDQPDRLAATITAVDAYPVILKPDAGQRGYAVRLARNEEDLRNYVDSFARDFVVQTYHPGPQECGIFWVRDSQDGRIFSITRKDFPVVIGDGTKTLAQLVRKHPRYALQEDIFRTRFEARWNEIIPIDQAVRLTESGNHAQGTLFRDGSDLLTPELEQTIRQIADQFEGFDFGRFDLRYETDEALRRGENFGIVELNGITSESTNLYDPSFPKARAYSVLFEQWRIAFDIGLERRKQGVKPVRLLELVRSMLGFYANRPETVSS